MTSRRYLRFKKFSCKVQKNEQFGSSGVPLRRGSRAIKHSTVGLSAGLIAALSIGLKVWLVAGLIAGSLAGLERGGSAVIKHYALRLILWLNGYTPFKFIKFLDQCAKLILLKKVGGGYIFIHRMLLEYFADTSVKR